MFKHSCFLFLLFISFNLFADIEVPEAVKSQIVNAVISDEGGYDAAEIDFRIREWILDQPLPDSSAELTNSGNCTESCGQSGGDLDLPSPRKVKIKGREVDGSIDRHFVVTWKRPQALPDDSNLKLKRIKGSENKGVSTL